MPQSKKDWSKPSSGSTEGEISAVSTDFGASTGPQRKMDPKYVLEHAKDTFGSEKDANAWLNEPNWIFENKTPREVLTKDPAAV